MKVRKSGVIQIPRGTPGDKITEVLLQKGAKPGEVWSTEDSGLTWRKGTTPRQQQSVSFGRKRADETRKRRKVSA